MVTEIQDISLINDGVPSPPDKLTILDEDFLSFEEYPGKGGRSHTLNPATKSYVIAFTGRRGDGKTMFMTFYTLVTAYRLGMKVFSNFPIECLIRRHNEDESVTIEHFKSEPLNFYQLLCFGSEYEHSLILLDEAADLLNYLQWGSTKGRLFDAFLRQIRKLFISLCIGTQDLSFTQKGSRWQTDIEFACEDQKQKLGDESPLLPGELIRVLTFDLSGALTGESKEERIWKGKKASLASLEFRGKNLWGTKERRPVFDSHNIIDLFDSLRKVELKLTTAKIDEQGNRIDTEKADKHPADKYPVSPAVLMAVLDTLEKVEHDIGEGKAVWSDWFYGANGSLGDRDKNNLGKVLSQFNTVRGRDPSSGKRWLGFAEFDYTGFRDYVLSKQAK